MGRSKVPLSKRQAGLKHGWRSGLEESVGADLEARGVPFEFETEVLLWVPARKTRRYTPDFVLLFEDGHRRYVETKGRWTRDDRLKMECVVWQHPEKDLRMLFMRDAPITKGSQTRYTDWARKHLGIPVAVGNTIPEEWLER